MIVGQALPPAGVQTVANKSGTAGFTVLELVIALVILSAGVAMLSGTFSDSLRRTGRAQGEAAAARVAASLWARLGADIPLRIGRLAGDTDGVDWAIVVQPYGSDEDQAAWTVAPADVSMELTWMENGHRETATWRSIRIMPATASTP